MDALKAELSAEREKKMDHDGGSLGGEDAVKPNIKNRRVLKGHFAKIYAMHWADAEGEAGKQLAKGRDKPAQGKHAPKVSTMLRSRNHPMG